MTKSSRLQSNKKTEENKIKESLLNKKEIDDTAVKDIRNLFRLEIETKAIKDRIYRDIKSLFDNEEEEN